MLEEMRKQGAKVYDHETAVVLRAIERGAREARKELGGSGDTYLLLMGRLLQVNRLAQSATAGTTDQRGESSIVLP